MHHHHPIRKENPEKSLELSRSAPRYLPRLTLQRRRPSTHQSFESFPTLSQSGKKSLMSIVSSTQKNTVEKTNKSVKSNRLLNIIGNCTRVQIIRSTLAFWIDRPLISSLISTIDVLISAKVKEVNKRKFRA